MAAVTWNRVRGCAAGSLVVAAVALVAAGCGGGDGGDGGGEVDIEQGRTLFKQKCGSCHALADAGTQGTMGPNLDEAHLDRESILRQIETGGGAMPANLYEGEKAETVAGYVAQVAGSGAAQ